MKTAKTFVGVFFAAFLCGCILASATERIPASAKIILGSPEKVVAFQSTLSLPTIETKFEQEPSEEDRIDDGRYNLKLLTTGEFHGDEVKAKSGETWLGLFKQKNNYYLRFTKIKVSRVRDEIIDEDSKEKTGKKVSVNNLTDPIFLLKNPKMLRETKVTTLFYRNEDNNLPNKYLKNFNLNGKAYTLKVVSNQSANEFLDPSSKLIIVSGNTQQVIYSGGCADCSWHLYWVGDLDGDGKMDLYANLTDHYNVSSPILFLSSQAKKGKLLKGVAQFTTVGC